MEILEPLSGDEFAPETTYLNTAGCGLLPRRAVDAIARLAGENAAGTRAGAGSFDALDAVRASFARLVGVGADRVALGSSVSVHVALVAHSLPAGAEVLAPEGEFSSVVQPFAVRGDLKVRYVPLESLAESVRPGTALVAFSSVQSADGRVADLAAVRAAAAAHGARTLLDASQSAGWLPLDAGAYDYTVTAGFKFLTCPRGTSFLTVTEEAQEQLAPLHSGWLAAADLNDNYGPVRELAGSARRYDEPASFLSYHGAAESLAVLEAVGIEAVRDHDLVLAGRLRAGLAALGHRAVAEDSAVVAVPGLDGLQPALLRDGVYASARGGNLRFAVHLYNSSADVDRALEVVGAAR
ncbi:aminotransferase class V-fold PLP-dependent enzyme [Streptomyces sp. NPDC058301]|uniref:aminotransferase class V-fold PLP-dependent enzyme n=1 Tax=Streptomyces sp. NPDC058301 TaxID=3346436 RepID=UPI0036E85117